MNMRVKTICAAIGLVALGACAPQGYDGTEISPQIPGRNNTERGLIAGATAGGIFGAVRNKGDDSRARSIAKGVTIGAILGGVGGSILDSQQKALQRDLSGSGATVNNHGDYLSVVMPESILFATDSSTVSSAAARNLYAVAQNLQQYPNSRIEVIGHTDSTGSASYNQSLSQRRASAVSQLLVQGGVASGRISTRGMGESQPIASNDTSAGRAQNRRVEIIIRPTQ